ncbi:MAG: bifunctional phosphopantothenoylcysteine decarboxylase/phosphopantothenate--cysteine ligase CoaBC [Alphaproteobacteria bacterium]|nr:bifunctional phosphopantothenoylcysteine decarboxylase/phosphopantothenate--cysteine ligase CoaBC [Alphaproteobacteria bacterium]MBT5859689.1 bifunctional phosphopantothenoylcysteine decarboxylase/phosphopantothenate--cysteine ligase CoaBC [Alphaproteobacteria bacterium]
MDGRRVLLIIPGGIAAYKCLELIRLLRAQGAEVPVVLTKGGGQFVTPLSVSALSGANVYTDLHGLIDEAEMGHIRLSRDSDLIVVAPATADILAKMTSGLAGDLATAVLLATDKPVLVAPAMNVKMWEHPATMRNVAQLRDDGIRFVGPASGALADGEVGPGRLAELSDLMTSIEGMLADAPVVDRPALVAVASLAGMTALVTSGPTFEPIDPVRFIANASSGKQGHAIAAALARAGAQTTLISGPTDLPDPDGVMVHRVRTAQDMLAAATAALPADIAVCAAAVSDWRVAEPNGTKIKKGGAPPVLNLIENPDILATLAAPGPDRPGLVVGFAAETESDPDALVTIAREKREAKACDWIIANDVTPGTDTFGGDHNAVQFVTEPGAESWGRLEKVQVAERLVARIAAQMSAMAGAA